MKYQESRYNDVTRIKKAIGYLTCLQNVLPSLLSDNKHKSE
jgi:hypothetical protein